MIILFKTRKSQIVLLCKVRQLVSELESGAVSCFRLNLFPAKEARKRIPALSGLGHQFSGEHFD